VRLLEFPERIAFDRRVTHNLEQRLVIVDVAVERGDVEVADDQRRVLEALGPARHPLDKVELLAELGVLRAVGNVAARRDVDVLENHPLARPEQLDPDVARLAVVLPVVPADFLKRNAADRGDAVVTLLPMDNAMGVPGRLERRMRELLLAALDLLQTQHVGPFLLEQAHDLVDAQADRIDVPGGDRDHGASDRDGTPPAARLGPRPADRQARTRAAPYGAKPSRADARRPASEGVTNKEKPPSRGQWDGGSF
jgi:hypothetical protein